MIQMHFYLVLSIPIKLSVNRPDYSINVNSYEGPAFGYNFLFIADQSNINNNSFTNINGNYQLPSFVNELSNYFLAGTSNFLTTELLVKLIKLYSNSFIFSLVNAYNTPIRLNVAKPDTAINSFNG